jgi:signal transduction histidine kinase
MKKITAILVTIIMFFISTTSYSQANDKGKSMLDSLLVIANKPEMDTIKLNALINIARFYVEKGEYKLVKQYAASGLAIANKIDDKKSIALASYYIGYGIGALGNYDSTKIYFDRAEKIMVAIKDTANLVNLYIGYSILSSFQSDNTKAISYLLKSSEILKNSNTPAFRKMQSQVYGNLGIYLAAENQLELGVEYQKKGLNILSFYDNPSAARHRTTFYTIIAEGLTKLKKYTEARLYLDSALLSLKKITNTDMVTFVLTSEASYYKSINEPAKALATYLKALQLTDSSGVEKQKAEIAGNIASLYVDQKNYAEAEKFATIATNLGLKLRFLKVVAKGYEALKTIAFNRNNYKEAFHYAELNKLYADSVTNAETQKAALSMEGKYENKKKESEIANLTLSNTEKELAVVRRNRLLITGGITAAALLLLTGVLYRSSRQKQTIAQNEQKLQQEQIKFLERQQQVISLQSMVNGQETERTRIAKDLHDGLGGVFSTVKMHLSTLQHDVPGLKENQLFNKSYELVDTAAVEVRRIAHNMMPEVLMKLGLTDGLNDMCNNISSGKLLKVNFLAYGMEKRLNASTEIMLYRIVQELINNIIKHSQATEAIVQFNRDGNRLQVTVEDNGRGFNTKETDGQHHSGLETVQSRVDYLNGKLSIESEQGLGTTVMMDFLLNEQS